MKDKNILKLSVCLVFFSFYSLSASDEMSMESSGVPPATAIDDAAVSFDKFIENRKAFSERPFPENMEFKKEVLQPYINSLETRKEKELEIKRCNRLFKIKKYLLRLFAVNPYTGELIMPDGKEIKGCVSMANENVICVRPRDAKKSLSCKWEDFGIEQYIRFFTFYAEQRLSASGGEVSEENSIEFAAEDYLLLALLCDWLGHYEKAYEYAKKTLEICPSYKNEIREMFFSYN